MRNWLASAAALIMAVYIVGCKPAAVTYVKDEGFSTRFTNVKKVGIIIPAAEIYKIGADHSISYDSDDSTICRKHVEKAAVQAFSKYGFEPVLVPATDEVVRAIDFHRSIRSGYSPPPLAVATRPANEAELDAIMKSVAAESLAIVEMKDHISTGGRIARMQLAAMVGVTGGEGIGYAYLTVLDRSGRMFFDRKATSNCNFTKYDSVESTIDGLVADLTAAPVREK